MECAAHFDSYAIGVLAEQAVSYYLLASSKLIQRKSLENLKAGVKHTTGKTGFGNIFHADSGTYWRLNHAWA